MPRAHDDLRDLVALRSIADPNLDPADDCRKTADYLRSAFAGAGLADARLIEMSEGPPVLYANRPAPPGMPTVLLYCHYDVQPAPDGDAWHSPAFDLTERDGRWYGRGAADCKGNIVMHLTALRALGADLAVGLKLLAEGYGEQYPGVLEEFVPQNARMLDADAILVCDTGNFQAGMPTLTTTVRGVVNLVISVRTLKSPMHAGTFGGAAPDALVALIRMLATLHDEQGNATIQGLENGQTWPGASYDAVQFRRDANLLDGVSLVGDGAAADMLWARPSVTITGIDCPPASGVPDLVQGEARARVSLHIPPGTAARAAEEALTAHLLAVAPWGVKTEISPLSTAEPFEASTDGPAGLLVQEALRESYGRAISTEGQGRAIPLCSVFKEAFPRAEIMLLGVEEPRCLVHAPNESVDPSEIEHMALAEALFFQKYAAAAGA